MRFKSNRKNKDELCGEGEYRVQLYSRCAALVNEFCLDAREHRVSDLEDVEDFLRETLTPTDFAPVTVSVATGEGSDTQSMLQFDLNSPPQR